MWRNPELIRLPTVGAVCGLVVNEARRLVYAVGLGGEDSAVGFYSGFCSGSCSRFGVGNRMVRIWCWGFMVRIRYQDSTVRIC